MTTKIEIDAHAGWPVEVRAVDRFHGQNGNAIVRESLIATVPAGEKYLAHATSSRDIVAIEMQTDGKGLARPIDFADVVRGLKSGKRYARAGWNGNGMFIFLVGGSTFTVNREPLLSILGEGTEVQYHAHVDMKTATGEIVPWLASQSDILAEDWQEIA